MTPEQFATKINHLAAEELGRIFGSKGKAAIEALYSEAIATATAELRTKLAAAESRASWYAILLRRFTPLSTLILKAGAIDENRIPVETQKLRADIESALKGQG